MFFLYVWVGVIILSLIVEFITAGLVSIWFVGGGAVALVFYALGFSPVWQVLAFAVSSAIFLLMFRKLFKKRLFSTTVRTNSDAIIGKDFKLILPISFNSPGSVKVSGIEWSAVSENEMEDIESGTLVRVIDIKGNKLIVKKLEE